MATDVTTRLSNEQPLEPDDIKKKKWTSFVRDFNEGFDTSSSWFACICCSLACLINLGTSYVYGLFFPSILKEFKAGKAATAFVGSLTVSVVMVFGPVASKSCERFGCRQTMVYGALTCVVAVFASSFAPNMYVLFFTYGLGLGIGSSFVNIAAFQTIPLYFERHRSLATAIVSVGPGGGLLLMSPIVENLLEHLGWRKSLMVLAAVNLVPCILGCSIRRKRLARIKNSEDLRQTMKNNGCCKCIQSMDSTALRNPMFLLMSLSMSVCAIGYTMPSIHLAKYAEELGIPITRSSWMYFAIGVSSLLSRLLSGKLCDTGWIDLIKIFQFATVLFGIADVLLPFVTSFEHFMVYSVTYGVLEGMIMTSMHCFMLSSFPGMGYGWFWLLTGFSYFIGPVLAGLIADLSGSYHPAFITAGGVFFISALLPLLRKFIRTSNKPEEIKLTGSTEEELVILEKMTVL